ncbi:TPA: fimbrial protein [Escherichia coli]|uniref:fimbrial protein n=1 Tax=Escherichia coli TaxID=562 RepID=UPI000F0AD2BD|nr:fimbrial protein [Escherichia coli]EFA4072882.1 fimbrial protein [Escherichia coli O96]EEU9272427.1 fimbrial protein [Escherichia coli]EFB6893539.1 fimbrial protein [Escherichia coli]EFC6539163.1 fimbrial protein [Escherichia coli]EFH3870777.1 fimbrial protein [Escherichia coli]
MKRILLTSALIGLGLPAVGSATDLQVDFTATVLATTCTITIEQDGGPVVTSSGNDEYSLTIPDVGLDKVVTGDVAAQANFKLKAKDCSNGYSKIFTTLTGTSVSGKLIVNEASSGAAGVGMGIKRRDAADSAFFTPNNTDKFEWSSDEKTNGVPLTVALRETTAGAGRTGAFQAKATFNFTYE